jgi:hypothetical protein
MKDELDNRKMQGEIHILIIGKYTDKIDANGKKHKENTNCNYSKDRCKIRNCGCGRNGKL